jgi:Matrixin/PEP-CTERM motif
MKATRTVIFLSVVSAATISGPGLSRSELIQMPFHNHAPSPVTTFHDGHPPPPPARPLHQHQHRTGHDPSAGVHNHGGAGAYTTSPPASAPRVWVGRDLVAIHGAGAPDPGDDWAHGHQGHELPDGRFHVHTPVANDGTPAVPAGTGITPAEVARWIAGAAADVAGAIARWLAIGNAAGPKNWPGVEGPGNGADPPGGGLPAPGAGVPWHSSIGWGAVVDPPVGPTEPHEVHVVYGEAGGNNAAMDNFAAVTRLAAFGHAAPGAGAVTVIVDDDQDWFYGGAGAVPAGQLDFFSVILHEWGHVLGLGHFGTTAAGYIMADPFLGPGASLRTIDPDAIHGIRDLYAIADVPEPSTLVLLGTGLAGFLGYCWRRRQRAA